MLLFQLVDEEAKALRLPIFPKVSRLSKAGGTMCLTLNYKALMKILLHHLSNALQWRLWAPVPPTQ